MTDKKLSHFEVVATMPDGYMVRGFCSEETPPQLEYMDTICVFEELTLESAYTEVRTKDIARLRVKPVLIDDQEEPAQ